MPNIALEPRQAEALAALLSERTIADAATKAGVPKRTLEHWLYEDEDFREAYDSACMAATETACNRLRLCAERAIATLEKNLTARRVADQNRAAAALLHHLERVEEKIDNAKRIRALEQKIAALKKEKAFGVIG